jgi:hypothetical protein
MLTAVGIAVLLAGCAGARPPAPTAGAQAFTGEVWTWDTQASTVTLMQDGGQAVRVRVSPEQLRTLRHHQWTTVTGTPAVADIPHTTIPAGQVNAVPRGQPELVEVKGTVTTVDARGRLALQSDRGPLHVWVAAGADQRFARGAPVTVRMSVQPVDLVPATAPTTPAASPVAGAASPSSEPGDHAVVTGRLVGINPGGVLVVESPTGPIQVLAGDTTRYKVGDWLQVRTSVRAAS